MTNENSRVFTEEQVKEAFYERFEPEYLGGYRLEELGSTKHYYGSRLMNAQWEMFKEKLMPEIVEDQTPVQPVFVFGSNEAGIHGAGAALFARRNRGAVYGMGMGHHGNSYALPTKDVFIRTLPLVRIGLYIADFHKYAHEHPELTFEVTKIGCGLAGYTESDIAPMVKFLPENCILPKGWRDYVKPDL